MNNAFPIRPFVGRPLRAVLFTAVLLAPALRPAALADGTGPAQRHLGGCILNTPEGRVPDDLYRDNDIVPTDEYPPFTKKLEVRGITLIGRDDISDGFMRNVAKVVREIFPRQGPPDAAGRDAVLRNLYLYKTVIPLFKGKEHEFAPAERPAWEATRDRNSVCDIIMESIPGQVNEVVEHILHHVTDVGLQYALPGDWGLSRSSTLYRAMREATDKGYYDVQQYEEERADEAVWERILLQEYAYWVIYTAWDLRRVYGPSKAEWSIMTAAELKAKLPLSYDLFRSTVPGIMAPPERATLDIWTEPPNPPARDDRKARMERAVAEVHYDVPAKPEIDYGVLDRIDTSTDPLGVVPLPRELGRTLNGLFSKYTKHIAPNGKPIHLFAQPGVSDLQLARAREILKFHLTDAPGTRYGSDKAALANRMADVRATLIYTDTEAKSFATRSILRDTELRVQDLYATESPVEGSYEYLHNAARPGGVFTRDASYEEIMHLVHDKGIEAVLPDFHRAIVRAEQAAVKAGIYRYGKPAPHEYIITGFDLFFGLWEHDPQPDGGSFGKEYPFHSREGMRTGDPALYALVEDFWLPYLTYDVRVDPSFEGTFKMVLDKDAPYTFKSRYLVNVSLTGSLASNILGNDWDNRLTGNDADNVLAGGGGDDVLAGGGGTDTAVFSGNFAEYLLERLGGRWIVTDSVPGRDGRDALAGIEVLRFQDRTVPWPQ